MSAATLTSKGQTTIPKEIREGLALKSGDRLEFHLLSDSSAILRVKRGSVDDFVGVLRQPGRAPVSVEAMNVAIAREARRKYAVRRK